jgi:hypothetical protein
MKLSISYLYVFNMFFFIGARHRCIEEYISRCPAGDLVQAMLQGGNVEEAINILLPAEDVTVGKHIY